MSLDSNECEVESVENAKACRHHDMQREKQEKNFDKRREAKPKDVKVGEKVLIKRKKSTTKPS